MLSPSNAQEGGETRQQLPIEMDAFLSPSMLPFVSLLLKYLDYAIPFKMQSRIGCKVLEDKEISVSLIFQCDLRTST